MGVCGDEPASGDRPILRAARDSRHVRVSARGEVPGRVGNPETGPPLRYESAYELRVLELDRTDLCGESSGAGGRHRSGIPAQRIAGAWRAGRLSQLDLSDLANGR